MEDLSQLLCRVNPLTLLSLLPLFFQFLGQAIRFHSANQKRGFNTASKQSCAMNQPQLLQSLPYRKACSKDGCKEVLQDGKLSHARDSRQKKSDGQDLWGGQNLPCCWLNSQQAAGCGVAVPANSHKHQSG